MNETDMLLSCAVLGIADLIFIQAAINILSGNYLAIALLFAMAVAIGLVIILSYIQIRWYLYGT